MRFDMCHRRRYIARFLIALVGVAMLSGCVVAPGGYDYGYRVHPIIRPMWHPGWGWRR